jgi:hypothetical protein
MPVFIDIMLILTIPQQQQQVDQQAQAARAAGLKKSSQFLRKKVRDQLHLKSIARYNMYIILNYINKYCC